MKRVQLPRFKDHIGLGEKPKYKSYLLRLHEEDANNEDDDNFEAKSTELCLERRVLPHPKKRMQLFLESDEKSNDESTNVTSINNACATTLCPSDVANPNLGYRADRMDGMCEITGLPYPQSLSQIPVNHVNFATSNCDLDPPKQRKLQKEYKLKNGFGTGYVGSPYSSHPISSPKVPSPVLSRQRPGHHYSKGKSVGKNITDDRSSLQNTTSSSNPCLDDNSHSMNLPFVNPYMYPEHDIHQQNHNQEQKLLAEIQYNQKIFDDFMLDKNEYHSCANPNAPRSPDAAYILPQPPRHDEETPMLSSPSHLYSRGANSAQDLRLPNSSRRLAQIINEVSCGKQAVLRELVPFKAVHTRPPTGDSALRRRSGFHEQEFWQNDPRRDATHPHYDADFGMDGMPPQGLQFPQYPGLPVPSHGEDVTLYPPHPPHHYGYGPPLQYTSYEREDVQSAPVSAGATAPSLSARDKTISWLSAGDSLNFTPYKPADGALPVTSQNSGSAKKSDDYRGKSMSAWEFRHVAHFLIEATHDLGIQYEDTDFSQLSKVNGQKLIAMEPEHFETFAPSQGQRIFDYVRRHRNHEVLTDGTFNNFMDSSPDVPSERSIETPPVSYNGPAWTSAPDLACSNYPPVDTLSVEKSFSNAANQGSPQSSKVPSPYSSMSMETTLPSTSTFSGQAPFQFQTDACSSDPPVVEHQTHLHSAPQPIPYSSMSSMGSGSLLPPSTAESRTSYHSQAQRPPPTSSGSHQGKPSHYDANRPSSSMSTTISEIEESSDDDEEDDGEGDDEDEEEEEEEVPEKVIEEKPPEPPKKRGPGRPPKPENERKKKKKTGRLWEFIRNLLLSPETCPSIVKWEDPETGVFRFVQSEKVAEKWGMRKNNKKMNYEKLSRAMRYYYKGKVFEPVLGRRLVYKFGVNAKGWKPNEGNFGE